MWLLLRRKLRGFVVTTNQVAWIVRSAMVAAAALFTFMLAQPDGTFAPNVLLIAGAGNVILAALNAQTVAEKVGG